MEDFYKNILCDIIAPYIDNQYKETGSESINFDKFFSEIVHNKDIDTTIQNTIVDCYMKSEQLEDLDDEDLEELISEQISTLKDYVYTEITV